MTSYNIYPPIPSAPEDPQVGYHVSTIQKKQLEERYKEKYKKYTKALNRLLTLNACASRSSVATRISSVATLSTFIGLPVSIPLGAISLAGVSISGLTTVLTKKYQKKLSKVTKLTDIITPAIAVFETCLSKALRNGKINEDEFNLLEMFHLKTMNELTGVDRKMEAENRNQCDKNLLEEINEIKKNLGTRVEWFVRCVISHVTSKMDKIYYQPKHLWKGQKAIKKL